MALIFLSWPSRLRNRTQDGHAWLQKRYDPAPKHPPEAANKQRSPSHAPNLRFKNQHIVTLLNKGRNYFPIPPEDTIWVGSTFREEREMVKENGDAGGIETPCQSGTDNAIHLVVSPA